MRDPMLRLERQLDDRIVNDPWLSDMNYDLGLDVARAVMIERQGTQWPKRLPKREWR